jgi:hypothetical protein
MKTVTKLHIKRLPLYGAAGALVLASCWQNFEFAIGVSVALAAAMVASDMLKGPALHVTIAALRDRDWGKVVIAAPLVLIFAAASLAAAISFQAQTRGDAVGQRQAVIDEHARLDKQIKDATTLRDEQDALANVEKGKSGTKCKSRCEKAMARAEAARATIAAAQAAMAKLDPPLEADAGAATLARLLKTDETTARTIMTVIAVALVEVGSLMAVPLAMAFGAPRPARPVAPLQITGPYTLDQAERDLLYEIARGNTPTVYDWAARWKRSVAWVSDAIVDMERRGVIQRSRVGRRKVIEIA